MKRVSLVFMTLMMSIISYGQNNVWALPNNDNTSSYLDWDNGSMTTFPTTDPISSTGAAYTDPYVGYTPFLDLQDAYNSTNLHMGAANAIKGTDGELLFFIVGNSIFDSQGRTIWMETYASSEGISPGYSEISVVPDPGNCNRFYILTDRSKGYNAPTNTVNTKTKPYYAILDVSESNTNQSFNLNANGMLFDVNGNAITNFMPLLPALGYSISSDNPHQTRVNYAVAKKDILNNSYTVALISPISIDGNTPTKVVLKFKITSSGFQSYGYNLVSSYNNILTNLIYIAPSDCYADFTNSYDRSEFEIYAKSDGSYKVVYGTHKALILYELDNNLNYVTNSVAYVNLEGDGVLVTDAIPKGVEFSPDGRYVYFTHNPTTYFPNVIDCWDTQTNNSLVSLPWASTVNPEYRYSFIEIQNNKLYMPISNTMAEIPFPNTPAVSNNFNGSAQSINYVANYWIWDNYALNGNLPSALNDLKSYTLPDQIDGEDYTGIGPMNVSLPNIPYSCNGVSDPICVINGSTAYTYNWTNSYGSTVGTSSCFTPPAAGIYFLTVTSPFGCEQNFNFKIKEEPIPTIPSMQDYNICMAFLNGHENFGWMSNPFTNYGGDVDYLWNVNGNSIDMSNDFTPWNIGFNGFGTYTVNIVLACSNISLTYSFNVYNSTVYSNSPSPFVINPVEGVNNQVTFSALTLPALNPIYLPNYNVVWSVYDGVNTSYYYNVGSVSFTFVLGTTYQVSLTVIGQKGCTAYNPTIYNWSKVQKSSGRKNAIQDETNTVNNDLGESKISIYPNPTTDVSEILIENFDTEKTYTMVVYSITGEIVIQSEITQSKSRIDLIDLENGVYFVEIFDGVERTQKKLVKAN